jgi:hypothetical protein
MRLALLGGGAFVAVVLLVIILWAVLRTPTPAVNPAASGILEVTSDNKRKGPQVCRSIREAMKKAKKGDVIHLFENVQENINQDFFRSSFVSDITIQAAPGNQVKWLTAERGNVGKPLLLVKNASGFKVKDIIFDGGTIGERSLDTLVRLELRCPGLAFENVHFNNFTESGLIFFNAFGEKDQRMEFKNLEFNGDGPRSVGVSFYKFKDSPLIEYLTFSDMRFNAVKFQYLRDQADAKLVFGEDVSGFNSVPPPKVAPPPPPKKVDPKTDPKTDPKVKTGTDPKTQPEPKKAEPKKAEPKKS